MGCPDAMIPLSAKPLQTRGTQSVTSYPRLGRRCCRRDDGVHRLTALGAPLRIFCQGLLPQSFLAKGIHKAVELFAHSWGFDFRASGHIHTPVGLHAADLRVKPPPSPLQFGLIPRGNQFPSGATRRHYIGLAG